MGTYEVHIREQGLPGIGRRFEVDVGGDLTLIVIARRDGSRDIAVTEKNHDEPRRSVHLDREQAVTVGSLLLGARFSDDGTGSAGRTVDLGTVVVGPESPAIGKVPSDLALPSGSDAAVVAVARDDTPQLLEDHRHRPCELGDRLVIAARPEHLEQVIHYLAG